MKDYNRKPIENLDPRQCVYVDFNEGATNLVINGKNAIEQKQEQYSEELTENELDVLKKHPNYEAYRWFNKRGVCVLFRTEKNENMYNWDDLLKLS